MIYIYKLLRYYFFFNIKETLRQFIEVNVHWINQVLKSLFSPPCGHWPFVSVRVHDYVSLLLHTEHSDVMLYWNMLITHCHSGLQDVVCQSIFRRITDPFVALDCLEMCLPVLYLDLICHPAEIISGWDQCRIRLGFEQSIFIFSTEQSRSYCQFLFHTKELCFLIIGFYVFTCSSILQLCRYTKTNVGSFH